MKKLPRWYSPRRWFARSAAMSAVLLALLLPFAASAQQQGLELDIVGGNAAALPIAVVPMPYQGGAAAPDTDVAAVIAADLNRSGQFRSLPEGDLVERPTRGNEVNYPTWRAHHHGCQGVRPLVAVGSAGNHI